MSQVCVRPLLPQLWGVVEVSLAVGWAGLLGSLGLHLSLPLLLPAPVAPRAPPPSPAPADVLDAKIATLVGWIREARHFIAFTGAGTPLAVGTACNRRCWT
jgi:hypothetical protein